jgi:hypothetical protein
MNRSYSRRELYALGEPLGDSATYRKAGGLVFGDGGGGGGGGQPDKTTQVSELPEWARPYAKDTLAKGAALTDINQNPYQTYGANRIAGFSPLQEQSFQGAANMQPSQQLGVGSNLAAAAGIGALGANYRAGQFTNQFQDPGQYQPGQFSMSQVEAPNLQNFQMGPAERVRTQSFTRPGSAEQYMSPYMQNVVDIQKREAQRQSGIQGTQQQAQAVGAGAFGGSRDAIMRAERERNLGQQMGDIQATGSQAAFQQAQQQFNAEQQARLQAQQANQQAGLTVGGQNLGARLGVQQLGAGQNLQSQLANQQAFQQAQNAAEQSRQFGAGQGLQAAGLGAQYGQATQQLGEQSRQYGAGLGMQGLQTALQGAGQLGQLGSQQFQQGMDINKLQSAYGGQMQQQAQRPLDMAYQDFLNQQNYPYKQLGFMSDMIRGLPLGQQSTSSIYEAPGSTMGQLAGLGLGAYGISRMMAEGGLTGYAEGGDVTSDQNVESIMSKLSDEQLAQAKQAALGRQDVEQANMIDAEIAQRASIRGGLGGAFNQIPVEQQEQMMAGGGIVAFADRGAVVEKPKKGLPASVETAIAKTAEKTGESEFDLRAETQKNVEMFKRDYQPLLEQINKSVEEARPDSEAIKQQGLGQALAQFGFKMAAAASRPKAKFLESASIAAPELSSAAAKTQDLIATQQQNYNRLKMDQAKYEVALQNGNMRDAAILAGQIRAARQADKQLAATIDQNNRTYEVQKEQLGIQRQQVAATAARQPENLRDIAAMLRKDDPSLTMSQALERASKIRYGTAADINAGQKDRSALSRDLIEIDKEFSPMILQSDSAAGKKSRIERQQRIDRLYQSYGLTPPSGEDAPASTISPSAFKIEKIGK